IVSNPFGATNSAVAHLTILPPPVIAQVAPGIVGPGEVLTIRGRNFGNVADNLCVLLNNGCRLIGLNVLRVQDDLIKAEVPPIPDFADGVPHLLEVGVGLGTRQPLLPDFADVLVLQDPWNWIGLAQNMAVAPMKVTPVARPGPFHDFHSPPASN